MKAFITAMALVATTAAHAYFWDANELYTRLISSDPSDQRTGIAYITGSADTMANVLYCPPTGTSVRQVHDVVLDHLRNIGANRQRFTGDRAVHDALSSVWPCPKRGNGV